MRTCRAVVFGRVQGVGFRAFVCRLARARQIEGEVWNRADGAVELVASHSDPSVLDEFLFALRSGPGSVSEVRVQEEAEDAGLRGFRIAYR